jgi:hypothetical protein
MQLWFKVVIVGGVFFAAGLAIIIYDLLTMGRRSRKAAAIPLRGKAAAAV